MFKIPGLLLCWHQWNSWFLTYFRHLQSMLFIHYMLEFLAILVVLLFNYVRTVLVVFDGGSLASWLVRLTPDWAVCFQALAGDIVLCSWERHLTLTVPLLTQIYKWVLANLMLGATLWWTSIPSRGAEMLLGHFMLLEMEISTCLMCHLVHMQTSWIAIYQYFHCQAPETHPAKQTSAKS